jgi:hypothetical protein
MLKGSCACGQVRYEVRGELIGPVTYCHCWRCRKHSGSSFGTTVGVKSADLVFLAGEELLASWESSPGVHRFFAGCCSVKAALHFRVGSKVPWLTIHDDLAQEPSGPPFREHDGERTSPAGDVRGLPNSEA